MIRTIIQCNRCGCTAFASHGAKPHIIRRCLRECGWMNAGKVDLCPNCVPSKRKKP